MADFGIDDLPSVWERITILGERIWDRFAPAIGRYNAILIEKRQQLVTTGSEAEDFRRAWLCTHEWILKAIQGLREAFMAEIRAAVPRVDLYGIERTVMQIVVLAASLAYHLRRTFSIPPMLRGFREQAGLTQRGLGERLKKPQSWVHNCETANRRVDISEFVAWCEACGIKPRAGFERFLRLA